MKSRNTNLLCTLQVEGITINQYESQDKQCYSIYLVADIIRQISKELRPLFGTGITIVSDQIDPDRIFIVKGLEDNTEVSNFTVRLWNIRKVGQNEVETQWTCFYEDETVTVGNMTGPRKLGSGTTRLSFTKENGYKTVSPA